MTKTLNQLKRLLIKNSTSLKKPKHTGVINRIIFKVHHGLMCGKLDPKQYFDSYQIFTGFKNVYIVYYQTDVPSWTSFCFLSQQSSDKAAMLSLPPAAPGFIFLCSQSTVCPDRMAHLVRALSCVSPKKVVGSTPCQGKYLRLWARSPGGVCIGGN